MSCQQTFMQNDSRTSMPVPHTFTHVCNISAKSMKIKMFSSQNTQNHKKNYSHGRVLTRVKNDPAYPFLSGAVAHAVSQFEHDDFVTNETPRK